MKCGKCGVSIEKAAVTARYRSDAPLCQSCENGEREADCQESKSEQ